MVDANAETSSLKYWQSLNMKQFQGINVVEKCSQSSNFYMAGIGLKTNAQSLRALEMLSQNLYAREFLKPWKN